MQDSRTYCGNDVMWWAKNRQGYTTDLSMAMIFTKEEAQAQHNMRETDIPWPKEYIDAKTRPAVDMQYIRRDEALAGSGIELRGVERRGRPKTEVFNCGGCGRFISEEQRYLRDCGHCGTSNAP